MSSGLGRAGLESIFGEHIIAVEFSRLVSRRSPAAVIVGGPPGSGAQVLTGKIEQELRGYTGTAPMVITPGLLEPYHPAYFSPTPSGKDLGRDVRAAGRLWTAMAVDVVALARADAVIEMPMDDPQAVVAAMSRLREAGHHVTVCLNSVPEVVSSLGVFAEFACQLKYVGGGRVIDQVDHDSSFRGVLEVAQIVDEDRPAHQARVYGRGGQVAFNLLDGGFWRYAATSIARAVSAERERPWSGLERRQFDALAQRLLFELGDRWYPELKAIGQRAIAARAGSMQAFPPMRSVVSVVNDVAAASGLPAHRGTSFQARHRR